MADALRRISGLHKHFGGIVATENVNLEVERGQIHAIIGPNGAGKTTLLAQLSGQLKPDSGEIEFAGHSITGFSMARRAREGLARSFQITSVVLPMTLLQAGSELSPPPQAVARAATAVVMSPCTLNNLLFILPPLVVESVRDFMSNYPKFLNS